MTKSVDRPTRGGDGYPTSDGQPMAESAAQLRAMTKTWQTLERRYEDRPDVHVGGDLMLCYIEGNSWVYVVPDTFVAFGLDAVPRDNYLLWKQGKAPDIVIEFTSSSTREYDLSTKKDIFQQIGVREYFLYDPEAEYLDPPLVGFRLAGGDNPRYVPIEGPPLDSVVLDLSLSLGEPGALVFHDHAIGERLLSYAEWGEQQRRLRIAAEARADRAVEERIAAEARADRAAERADRAEARIRELEAQLRALEGSA